MAQLLCDRDRDHDHDLGYVYLKLPSTTDGRDVGSLVWPIGAVLKPKRENGLESAWKKYKALSS